MDLTKEIIIANSLATMAAEKIMEVYQSPDMKVTLKDNYSPLTMADQTANDIIVEGLQRQFPAHAILAEESKDDPARLEYPWCWIVDPLDGTKEFVQRIPEFTVNIALSYRNRVVLGVICVPVTGELYWASQGEGRVLSKELPGAARDAACFRADRGYPHGDEPFACLGTITGTDRPASDPESDRVRQFAERLYGGARGGRGVLPFQSHHGVGYGGHAVHR